ncbi:hypothetical protein BK816_01755 [Boudabousia tangfeifanii]|uniref:DUF4235 domain-containing protein n=2 Tax=Boudabousia tangfeifanii TaxID=1912795 RepID=A0A1D9MIZ4_9ACTO|nr:hypothetical protein BK816_01755 [Boudabousia tangfeifanii]
MDIAWKVINGVALAGAALVANTVVKSGWKALTGNTPPAPGDEEATARLAEVLIFGALSGLVMAAARRTAVRSANKWYGGSKFNQLEV